MKDFIDRGRQMFTDDGKPKAFSFYCTVLDIYEDFNGNSIWKNAKEFEIDYLKSGGEEIKEYLKLIPPMYKQNK